MCVVSIGCLFPSKNTPVPNVPRELRMVSLPPYVIEPPDTLPPPAEPIDGAYAVDVEGNVTLGLTYGRVQIARMTRVPAMAARSTPRGSALSHPRRRACRRVRGEAASVKPGGSMS
jgi:hypothetical protein